MGKEQQLEKIARIYWAWRASDLHFFWKTRRSIGFVWQTAHRGAVVQWKSPTTFDRAFCAHLALLVETVLVHIGRLQGPVCCHQAVGGRPEVEPQNCWGVTAGCTMPAMSVLNRKFPIFDSSDKRDVLKLNNAYCSTAECAWCLTWERFEKWSC